MHAGSNWSRLAAAAAMTFATPAQAEDRTAQSSVSESGSGEDYVVRITNATFASELAYAPDGASSRTVVYEQSITSEQAAGREAVIAELEVTARGEGRELWTIRDDGNEGEALGGYYRTVVWGCCGAENLQRSYLAWTGKLAFASTADPLIAAIPNTSTRRAFAYLSSYAIEGFDREAWPLGVGVIAIVDGDRTVDRVLLEVDEENRGYEWTPELELSDPTGEREPSRDNFDLWSADGNPDPAGITGIDLVLSWDPEMAQWARLPITAGKFDLTRAELPDGLTARRLED